MSTELAARPEDFLTPRAELRRPQGAPDLHAQSAAFSELAWLVAQDPGEAIRRSGDIARRLCRAGSAGLSLMRPASGATTMHWSTISGALAAHEGAETPRDASPCGSCLDANETVLISRPDRVFGYLRRMRPLILEDLIVPLHDSARNPIGTFWVVHHDVASRFSSGDAHVMEQIAIQLTVSLRLRQLSRDSRALLKSHEAAQWTLTHDLAAERGRRKAAEASEKAVRETLADKEIAIVEAHHRVKNTLQIVSSLLSLQSRTSRSEEVRLALQQSQARLQVLAKAHELLYRDADDLREIPMPTLLREIGDALRQSFPGSGVSLQVASDEMSLAPIYAIPMALLVNEIVTNAYKHAFPNGMAGEIKVVLKQSSDGALLLQVSDNGVGMRETDDTRGLGLKLIRSFAARLHGDLTFAPLANDTGTVVTLRIGGEEHVLVGVFN